MARKKKNDAPRVALPHLQGHSCFGCGTANSSGLKMRFAVQGDEVLSEFVLSPNHAGWESIAHGGIISTALDEIMAWSVVAFMRRFFVTKSMSVRYFRPVPLGRTLQARGHITQEGERGCHTYGELLDDQGFTLARSQGEMTYISTDRLSLAPSKMREEMEDLFQQIEAVLSKRSGG